MKYRDIVRVFNVFLYQDGVQISKGKFGEFEMNGYVMVYFTLCSNLLNIRIRWFWSCSENVWLEVMSFYVHILRSSFYVSSLQNKDNLNYIDYFHDVPFMIT